MKKVVIFGGGSGLSQLLKGLKQFPMDITAVVSVSDNGSSTGSLREEFSIPAVGDITKVLLAMSTESKGVIDLFNYRFSKESSLNNHSIKNLIMTALLEMKGDFAHSLPILCDLLDVKGTLLPLTEDNVDLIGITRTGERIVGEAEITEARSKIVDLEYSKKIKVTPKVLDAIKKADLIVFSSGSLITSIMPNIIVPEIQEAIKKSKAKKLYICNMLTQPGETDNFKVSDHIKFIEKYIGEGQITAVIANSSEIDASMKVLAKSEGKDAVAIDVSKLHKMGVHLIADNLFKVEDGYVRHDALKTSFLIFSYLMEEE
ncbi:MAG: YvcK family protein [Bacilli bacterium]|nr:YvcK family protein [Bacilli bacterium]